MKVEDIDVRKVLDVYLHQDRVGELMQDVSGRLYFKYLREYLLSKSAAAISYSLPLRDEVFLPNECVGMFGGVLPEAEKREIVAKNLGITARNDFAMLEEIGGECAGAISFSPQGHSRKDKGFGYTDLNSSELADVLRKLPTQPLLAGTKDVRLSLAGVQDKLPVYVREGTISLPLGGAPSSHILKPAIERFKDVVFNEAFCLELASSLGISTVEAKTEKVEEIEYLLIKRYDRRIDKNNQLRRVHQEDFCQALNLPSSLKYQNEGGPGLEDCFRLVRQASLIPVQDLSLLLDAVIFNFLVGNNDAHGKNFSFIYSKLGCSVAPLYDLVCTVHYPGLSSKMAMKIGSQYEFDKVMPRHFEQLAKNSGLNAKKTNQRVIELAHEICEKLNTWEHTSSVTKRIGNLIESRCENVLSRFK